MLCAAAIVLLSQSPAVGLTFLVGGLLAFCAGRIWPHRLGRLLVAGLGLEELMFWSFVTTSDAQRTAVVAACAVCAFLLTGVSIPSRGLPLRGLWLRRFLALTSLTLLGCGAVYSFQRFSEPLLPWYAPLVPLPLGVWLLTPAFDLLVRGAGSTPAA